MRPDLILHTRVYASFYPMSLPGFYQPLLRNLYYG